MGEQETFSLEQAAASYAHWWREAGLDCATDEAPRRWREEQPLPFWRQDNARAPALAPPQPIIAAQQSVQQIAPAATSSEPATPGTLPGFLDWLARDDAQPESQWDGALILPPALERPGLLLMVDMPAADAHDLATLLEPGQRRFVQAMLASLGQAAQDTPCISPCISLTMRRPPGGLLDETLLDRLGDRMKQYLGLVRPGTVILLGDRNARALLGSAWRPGTAAMETIDCGGASVNIVTLASPELLMNRPAAKARSWQVLRTLHGFPHQ